MLKKPEKKEYEHSTLLDRVNVGIAQGSIHLTIEEKWEIAKSILTLREEK